MASRDLTCAADLCGELGYAATEEQLIRRFPRIATDPLHAIFVVEMEGAVQGWVHVQERRTLEADPYAEIVGLVVDRWSRRSGVGRALVSAASTWARERGYQRLVVRSNVLRDESHAFYAALGFSRRKTQHVYALLLGDGSESDPTA
jgi:N-acetylglutamate synthase-like GNAT family acetyltransferase